MPSIIDISLPIHEKMPIYPGNAPTTLKKVPSSTGTSVLTEISLTSHAGTHVDAPNHAVGLEGGIDSLPLDLFYGPCQVLDLTGCEKSITQNDLENQNINSGERILFKTKNSLRGFDKFYEDFIYLDGQAAEYLAEKGVKLVGIDSLSIKQRGLTDNTAHTALLGKGIPIIEGLDLSKVDAGEYTLIAFPLAFKDLDGSPARAILLK